MVFSLIYPKGLAVAKPEIGWAVRGVCITVSDATRRQVKFR